MHRKRTRKIWGDFEKVRVELSPASGEDGSAFACSRKPCQWPLWRVPHVLVGGRWKSQNRKNVYLSPYVEEPLNSKVIKNFVPELRSRVFVFRDSCVLCYIYIWTFYVRFTHSRIWLLYIRSPTLLYLHHPRRPGCVNVVIYLIFCLDEALGRMNGAGWLCLWVLWYINLCRLFNAKSAFPKTPALLEPPPSDCLVSIPGHSLGGGLLSFCKSTSRLGNMNGAPNENWLTLEGLLIKLAKH